MERKRRDKKFHIDESKMIEDGGKTIGHNSLKEGISRKD